MPSPIAWWKRDTARNSYYALNGLEGWLVTFFGSYAYSQLSLIGLTIGQDVNGGPCTTSCTVLMGTQRLELQTMLKYMTAMILGLGGFIALNLFFIADVWKHKGSLIPAGCILFAVFGIPVYWLETSTLTNFNSLFALSALFNILTNLFLFLVNVYIPHCMRMLGQQNSAKPEFDHGAASTASAQEKRDYGFAMSTWGIVFCSGGALLASTVGAIMSTKTPLTSQHVGLKLTTIFSFLVLFGFIACYFGLPRLPTRGSSGRTLDLFYPVRALFARKNAFNLLISYTIYTNVLFALFGNIFTVYYTESLPGATESTVYSVVSTLMSCSTYVVYFFIQRQFRLNLEKCLLFGYAFHLVPMVWGAIGMSRQDGFGFKRDWEFWVVMLVYQFGQSIVNATWRFLLAELVPAGDEYLWFGMWAVLYCATTWINSVVSDPLIGRTNIRFPLIMCLIFGLFPIALEALRVHLPYYKNDIARWEASDREEASRSDSLEEGKEHKGMTVKANSDTMA